MSVNVVLNGTTYTIPDPGDNTWGQELTDYFVALGSGVLQKAGGAFTLTAEVNFGATYGLKAVYYKSRATNPSSTGQIRLGNTEFIGWRNAANDDDMELAVDASNRLTYNGNPIVPSSPLTAARAVVTDGSGALTTATTTATEIAFVNGVTSAIQSQIDGKLSIAGHTALSVVGRSANSSGDLADIAAGTDNFVFRRSGTALGFGLLVSANLDPAAGIAFTQLAALTSGNILVGNVSNVAVSVSASGDVTISNAGVFAIGANKVTLAQMAQVATATFLGRTSASTGNVEALTVTQATALLNSFVGDSGSGGTKGLVPAPAAGDAAALKFLKADGTWALPTGAGDVVGPGSATAGNLVAFSGTTGKVIKTPSGLSYTESTANLSAAHLSPNYAGLATAGGTSTLTNGTVQSIEFTGSSTQTVKLPDCTTLVVGWTYQFFNSSTGAVTIQDSAAGALTIMVPGARALFVCTSIGSAAGSWLMQLVTTTANIYLAKSADYTLTATDNTVGFDVSGGSHIATLPTAVGNGGKILTIIKTDTSTNTVTVNTTSAQTVGGRASGAIILRRIQNTVRVQSDGTNWQILDKREHEVVTAAANNTYGSAGAAGNYLTLACSVALTYGIWRLVGEFSVNVGTGTAIVIQAGSGFFGADGANSASTPTALGGTISGDVSWTSVNGISAVGLPGVSSNSRYVAGTNEIIIQVTANTSVFLVPKVDYSTVGSAAAYGTIFAERIF